MIKDKKLIFINKNTKVFYSISFQQIFNKYFVIQLKDKKMNLAPEEKCQNQHQEVQFSENFNTAQNYKHPYRQASIPLQRDLLFIHEFNQAHPVKQKKYGLKDKHIKSIKTMLMGKSSQHCAVCISQFQQKQLIKKLPCKHIFHRQCAKNWFKINKTCPICRLDLEKYFVQKEKTEANQIQIQKKQVPSIN